jgi:hypothetical protein
MAEVREPLDRLVLRSGAREALPQLAFVGQHDLLVEHPHPLRKPLPRGSVRPGLHEAGRWYASLLQTGGSRMRVLASQALKGLVDLRALGVVRLGDSR